MSATPEPENAQYEPDPVFLNSRREAKIIFCVWFLCLIWAVPVSYVLGYNQTVTPGEAETVLGIPRWTFWGLFLPWLVADVITTAFCFRFLTEDDLDAAESEASPGSSASGTGALTGADGAAQNGEVE